MKLSDLAVKRPVTIAMFFLVIILLGSVSIAKLKMDLLPELNLPMAISLTSYEGVGPEEVENLVTRPIEGALGTVNGVKTINSVSSQGSSMVFVEFAWGTDMNFAINQMREKMDLVTAMMPEGVDKPMLLKLDPNMMPIMVLGFGGNLDEVTLDKLANDVIKPRLERVEGVATVDVVGGVQREIRISAIPQRLQAYGLSLDSIVSYLRMENRNMSAGTIEEGLKEHIVRVTGEFAGITEIEDLQVPLATGGYIRLGEIAQIEDTFKEKKQYVYMNGSPCVQISLQRQTDANTVKVSEAINQELAEIKKVLPAEAEIKTGFDQASFIKLAIEQVASNTMIGAVLAVFILFLFLRNVRSTLIIGTAIPISIFATFTLMYFGGLTLNMISMGGLALGVGMMVDNAIVILENIYRYRQEGCSRMEAAKKGSAEVSLAITASTLTSVAVFIPIVYVEGMASQIFKPMALTVTFSLIASLVVALTLVPMLSSKILKVDRSDIAANSPKRRTLSAKIVNAWGSVLTGLDNIYRAILAWAITNRKKVIGSTLILVIISVAMIPTVGMEFIPKQDSGEFTISIALPNGTAVRETQRVTDIVAQYVQELPEYDWAIYAIGTGIGMMGSSGSETATLSGMLIAKDERNRSIDEVLDELRQKCAAIPGAEIQINATDMSMVSSSQASIDIGLLGDNLEVLQAVADTIAERVKAVEGTREVETSLEDGRPEVHIKLNRQKADQYGISSTQLASLLATAINGTTATKYRTAGEEVDVCVVLEQEYRQNLNDLEHLTISSPTGALIPLKEIAALEIATGPTQINRINQSRRVAVTGEISGRDLAGVTQDIQKALDEIQIPPGVRVDYGGAYKEMIDAFLDLLLALILAIILVYMILASQFEGLLTPFVIMFALPPALIGVVFSLVLTQRTLSVPTFIGIIMLAGIVVNNAIVLVDYINTLRRRDGMEREAAILKAGPTRLRPILMTTLTTVLALIPSVIGIGEGAELSAPMATAVAGGLTISTLSTLVLIPCIYIVMDNITKKFRRLFGRTKTAGAVNPAVPESTSTGGE